MKHVNNSVNNGQKIVIEDLQSLPQEPGQPQAARHDERAPICSSEYKFNMPAIVNADLN